MRQLMQKTSLKIEYAFYILEYVPIIKIITVVLTEKLKYGTWLDGQYFNFPVKITVINLIIGTYPVVLKKYVVVKTT